MTPGAGRRPTRLFIVGAPRSGTTALFDFLRQHPDVCASDPKEPHYFCTDFHEESDRHFGARRRFPYRTDADYLRIFRDPSKPVALEGSTAYIQSAAAPANIRAFDPDARIVVMVREPVELLHSLHAKMVAYALEDIVDFREAIEAEPERRLGRRLPSTLFWPSSLFYSERVKLAEGIERFRAHFPAGRVKAIVYDDFGRDNLAGYREAAALAGLDLSFTPVVRRMNPNAAPRLPWLTRLAVRAGGTPLARLVSADRRHRLSQFLRRVNRKPRVREPLDSEFRCALMARFRPDVERLSAVLDRDLVTLWGYN